MNAQLSQDEIRYLEELAANAWPPEMIQIVDGWRLRANQGVTRRANSVWPNDDHGRVGLKEKMAVVDAFYARLGQPTYYQVCPAARPVALLEVLQARGYQTGALTNVQTAPIETVLDRSDRRGDMEIVLSERPTEAWNQAYAESEHLGSHQAQVRARTLERIGPEAVYVSIPDGDRQIALGRGVLERGWLGIFSMATHPDCRRQGYATVVLHALAEWARARGADQIYLQVMEENAAAKALYARAGFRTGYQYAYWYQEALAV